MKHSHPDLDNPADADLAYLRAVFAGHDPADPQGPALDAPGTDPAAPGMSGRRPSVWHVVLAVAAIIGAVVALPLLINRGAGTVPTEDRTASTASTAPPALDSVAPSTTAPTTGGADGPGGPLATYPTVRPISVALIPATVDVVDGCVVGTTEDGIEFVPIFLADDVSYTAEGLRTAGGDIIRFGTVVFMGGAPPTKGDTYVEPEPSQQYYIPQACPRVPLVPVFGLTSTRPGPATN